MNWTARKENPYSRPETSERTNPLRKNHCVDLKNTQQAQSILPDPLPKVDDTLATLLETAAHVHFAEQLGSYQLTTRM